MGEVVENASKLLSGIGGYIKRRSRRTRKEEEGERERDARSQWTSGEGFEGACNRRHGGRPRPYFLFIARSVSDPTARRTSPVSPAYLHPTRRKRMGAGGSERASQLGKKWRK